MRKSALLIAVLLVLSTLLPVFSSCGECEHVWEEKGYVQKEPTDKEVGYRIYTCTLCGEKNPVEIPMVSHVDHDYSKNQWGSDGTHHWLVCGFKDCTATTNKGVHAYTDARDGLICPICQSKSSEHSFTDKLKYDEALHWVLCDDEGCPCVAYKGPHSLPSEFEYDSESHWGYCDFKNCPALAHKAAHKIKAELEYDDSYHWSGCESELCGFSSGKAAHSLTEGKCSGCNYEIATNEE